ncbi:MAG: efflux RND transporter permease subunit [Candidatus Competibacteraceae bacterium]
MVLAIGIVVDDAIVVIENTESAAQPHEFGLGAREAARRAVDGPLWVVVP